MDNHWDYRKKNMAERKEMSGEGERDRGREGNVGGKKKSKRCGSIKCFRHDILELLVIHGILIHWCLM